MNKYEYTIYIEGEEKAKTTNANSVFRWERYAEKHNLKIKIKKQKIKS